MVLGSVVPGFVVSKAPHPTPPFRSTTVAHYSLILEHSLYSFVGPSATGGVVIEGKGGHVAGGGGTPASQAVPQCTHPDGDQ